MDFCNVELAKRNFEMASNLKISQKALIPQGFFIFFV